MPTLKRVIGLITPYWKHVALSAFCMVMFALLSGALIWMIGPLLKTLFVAGGEAAATRLPDAAQSSNQIVSSVTGFVDGIKASLQGFIDSLIVGATPLLTLKNLCILVVIIAVARAT